MVKLVTESPDYQVNNEFGIGRANWDDPDHLAVGQSSMHCLFRTVALETGDKVMPLEVSSQLLEVESLVFFDPLNPSRSLSASDFLNRRLFNDALLVMHKGKIVHESFRNGLHKNDRHVIHSCTKSLCAMIAAMACEENLLDVHELVTHYIPEFKQVDAWDKVTVQHVLNMTAGIQYSEDYKQADADYWSYARAVGYYPPLEGESVIGAKAWAIKNLNTRNHVPGDVFVYNSTLTNVLGMVLENVYQQNLSEIFEEKLYQKIGAEHDAYFNTDPQGFPITEGQFNCTLQDFARLGSVILHQGKNLNGEQLVPVSFIQDTVSPDPAAKEAYQKNSPDQVFPQGQYKNKFWVFEPEQKRFAMLGIHGQAAWFDLEQELMVITLGSYPKQDGDLMMSTFKQLWNTISGAL